MIRIYGKKDCIWCTRAKDECWKFNAPYEYKDAYEDLSTDEFKELFATIAPYAKTFPIIIVEGDYIGGYTELKQFLAQRDKPLRNLNRGPNEH